MSKSSMDILLDFERVIDEMGTYAFQNWKLGELVEGPIVKKYRVICTFMWPVSMMPDPAAAERLLNYNAKISFKKDWLIYPVKIKDQSDFRPNNKKPKLAQKQVWLVTINLPKSLIKDIQTGTQDILNSTIDLSDIDKAYEQGLDKQGIVDTEEESNESEEMDNF